MRQMLPPSPTKRLLLPQPALAWLAILGLVAFTALCIVLGAGSIIRLAFPLGSFAISILLYCRYPVLYIGFTWWLWILTPWIRRLIDYQSGWVDPSPVLLAPYLVTLVTLATFFRHLPKLYRQDGLPFVLSCAGVFYGFCLGLINSVFGIGSKLTFLRTILEGFNRTSDYTYTITGVLISTLDWITPILLGCHLFVNWQYYPQYRQNFQRTFYWGVLLIGIYGVLQYLVAPEWDRFWLRKVIALGADSFGRPEPLGIRVFSTMNSPGPFARFMMAGLLLLFISQERLRFFAAAVGYLAFLLSLVRSAWVGWLLALVIFSASLKSHLQIRLIITLLLIGTCAFSLTTVEPFSDVINARVQTLSNIQEDGSLEARSETYAQVLGVALLDILGNGFGLPGMDSAFLEMFLAMGWLGVIPFMGGIILISYKLLQFINKRFDPFVSAASAISLSILASSGIGNPLIGVTGVLFWSFQSIALAGHKHYYHYQRVGLERK